MSEWCERMVQYSTRRFQGPLTQCAFGSYLMTRILNMINALFRVISRVAHSWISSIPSLALMTRIRSSFTKDDSSFSAVILHIGIQRSMTHSLHKSLDRSHQTARFALRVLHCVLTIACSLLCALHCVLCADREALGPLRSIVCSLAYSLALEILGKKFLSANQMHRFHTVYAMHND